MNGVTSASCPNPPGTLLTLHFPPATVLYTFFFFLSDRFYSLSPKLCKKCVARLHTGVWKKTAKSKTGYAKLKKKKKVQSEQQKKATTKSYRQKDLDFFHHFKAFFGHTKETFGIFVMVPFKRFAMFWFLNHRAFLFTLAWFTLTLISLQLNKAFFVARVISL